MLRGLKPGDTFLRDTDMWLVTDRGVLRLCTGTLINVLPKQQKLDTTLHVRRLEACLLSALSPGDMFEWAGTCILTNVIKDGCRLVVNAISGRTYSVPDIRVTRLEVL